LAGTHAEPSHTSELPEEGAAVEIGRDCNCVALPVVGVEIE
jgi:hypothetical protein